jgi:hypothetical protein
MALKRIKEITAEEENFRVEQHDSGFNVIRRDSIKPLPEGSLVAKVFRITGYDRDCDGSLMARMESVDKEGGATGWTVKAIGLHPDSTWQMDSPDDIDKASKPKEP